MCSVLCHILMLKQQHKDFTLPNMWFYTTVKSSFPIEHHVMTHLRAGQFDFRPENGLPPVNPTGNVNGGKWSLMSNWVVKKKRNSGSMLADSCGFSCGLWQCCGFSLFGCCMEQKKKVVWVFYNLWGTMFHKSVVCIKIINACLT